MDTLLLDQATNDLLLDASRNIAVASAPYALAQDVASSVKTWSGEAYYDTTRGVVYGQVMGKGLPAQVLKASVVRNAKLVPNVVSAQCFIESVKGRALTGQVSFTDSVGNTGTVGLS
jgi:hypothetical protein